MTLFPGMLRSVHYERIGLWFSWQGTESTFGMHWAQVALIIPTDHVVYKLFETGNVIGSRKIPVHCGHMLHTPPEWVPLAAGDREM